MLSSLSTGDVLFLLWKVVEDQCMQETIRAEVNGIVLLIFNSVKKMLIQTKKGARMCSWFVYLMPITENVKQKMELNVKLLLSVGYFHLNSDCRNLHYLLISGIEYTHGKVANRCLLK